MMVSDISKRQAANSFIQQPHATSSKNMTSNSNILVLEGNLSRSKFLDTSSTGMQHENLLNRGTPFFSTLKKSQKQNLFFQDD